MDRLVGKRAAKKRGFFSGLIGVIELNDERYSSSKYILVLKDGTRVGFNTLNDIQLVDKIEMEPKYFK